MKSLHEYGSSIKNKKLIITQETFLHPVLKTQKRYQICALYENNKMLEASLQGIGTESILNNIYAARVQNVVSSLNAAFVEIGRGQLCYLPLEDFDESKALFTKKVSKKPIACGDELAVQVTKEAMKTKDAVVTTNLSFPGEYLVLTSVNHKIGVSSKLPDDTRRRLQELAQQLRGSDSYGMIMRTNAADVPEEKIREEFLQIKSEYNNLMSNAASRTVYSCLYKERPFYLKALMDTDKSGLAEVVTDDSLIFGRLQQCLCADSFAPRPYEDSRHGAVFKPPAADSFALRLYEDSQLPLARLYNMAGQIEAALKQRVWLKSGANIIIQPTEALTVIDVNSGKNTAKKDKQQSFYKINREAAEEIARQLRLRNISGIIIVDFIDLCDEAQNASLLTAFRSYLKKDPVPVQLVDMTKLGLVELTRKKQRKPLAEQM